ncbi:MAG: response regulator transcription factor [Lachnospiraceae bacterium]|nr:response regulator transcription factor [Lachnospiraceae bacterium]MBO5146913.1 response regulator transcription factor [Lachnospiraceae bacterium]
MFQIAVCDKDPAFCEYLKNCLETVLPKWNTEYHLSVWHQGSSIREQLMSGSRVDLLFLEIELEEDSGISIGKFIREKLQNFNMQLVYLSQDQGYAMQLFETQPTDFLIKPVSKEQITKLLQRFLRYNEADGKVFVYKGEQGNVLIPYDSIYYFQSMNHKVVIHTTEGPKEFYGKLADVEGSVPEHFVRIHKSYLVNEHFISCFYCDKVILQNNQKLTISRTYRNAVRERKS